LDYYLMMPALTRLPLLIALICALGAQAQSPEKKTVAPISSALDGELFYQLLLGELNVREGEPGAAYSLILDAARKTTDPRLFQRAVEIALQARSGDSALIAARAWRLALPASKEANRYVLQILIGLNRLSETPEPLKREISNAEAKDRATEILGLQRYFARASDKKGAVAALELALNDYLGAPGLTAAAWTVIGRLRLDANDTSGALDAARKGQASDAKSEHPALLALAIMNAKTPQAEAIVKKYLEGKALVGVRMDYARALIEGQRLAEAALQLQTITTEKPDFAEAWLIKGALELQDGKVALSETSLKRYIELTLPKKTGATRAEASRGLSQAYSSLAQIAELRKDYAEADSWLKRIDTPAEQFNAQIRRASLLARQDKLEEARKLIKSLPEKTSDEARQKVAAEIALLRDSKKYKQAYTLLSDAVKRNPNDYDFVYDMAMVAEKLGNLDEMERLLRSVIAIKPDYHHAYNALGYSLADRKIRLPESKKLILKALEFAPGDPFINDSLGWVEFRSGNMYEALRILQEAFKAKPDAEIAAHLGEVLWTIGQQEQALAAFKEGFQINPENETLLDTLKRLRIKF
jgi:tetratricopeptide (TPR) repeat protein